MDDVMVLLVLAVPVAAGTALLVERWAGVRRRLPSGRAAIGALLWLTSGSVVLAAEGWPPLIAVGPAVLLAAAAAAWSLGNARREKKRATVVDRFLNELEPFRQDFRRCVSDSEALAEVGEELAAAQALAARGLGTQGMNKLGAGVLQFRTALWASTGDHAPAPARLAAFEQLVEHVKDHVLMQNPELRRAVRSNAETLMNLTAQEGPRG